MTKDVDNCGLTVEHDVNDGPCVCQVSPTTHANWRNTLRPTFPRPVGCCLVGNPYFWFDSSAILPTIAEQLSLLRPLLKAGRLMTLFGHADPVGDFEYNKILSGRRARAVYALLTRNVDIWLQLATPVQGDAWGLTSSQLMLSALQGQAKSGSYFGGAIDGRFSSSFDRAVRMFQDEHALLVDGILGPNTRRILYRSYMDAICLSPSDPWILDPKHFLGDAEDPSGKGAFQGCGEHNPVMLLSKDRKKAFDDANDKTARDVANAPNRRVMAFIFRDSDFAPLDPAKLGQAWPCPAWNEPAGACRGQFWSDWENRLSNGDTERRYAKRDRTMACVFYDQFARVSPCEGPRSADRLSIWILDAKCAPMPMGTPYRVTVNGQVREGCLRVPGLIVERGLMLDGCEQADVEWGDYVPIQFAAPQPVGNDGVGFDDLAKAPSAFAQFAGSTAPERSDPPQPEPQPVQTIAREQLYVPGTVEDMNREANERIDPATVPFIMPNAQTGNIAQAGETRFILRKLLACEQLLRPKIDTFDNRLFFSNPLLPRVYAFPEKVIENGERGTYTNARRLNLLDPDQPVSDLNALAALQLENLGYGADGLDQFRSDRGVLGGTRQVQEHLDEFHKNPMIADKKRG